MSENYAELDSFGNSATMKAGHRPIGTEYEYAFPPSASTGYAYVEIFTYRVIGYSRVEADGGQWQWAQSIHPITSRRIRRETMTFGFDGRTIIQFEDGAKYSVGSFWEKYPTLIADVAETVSK